MAHLTKDDASTWVGMALYIASGHVNKAGDQAGAGLWRNFNQWETGSQKRLMLGLYYRNITRGTGYGTGQNMVPVKFLH